MHEMDYVTVCQAHNYQKARVKGKFMQAFDGYVEDQNNVVSLLYYILDIKEDNTEVIMGIHQDDDSAIGGHLKQILDTCLVVIAEDEEDIWLWEYSEFTKDRDLFFKTTLDAGTYSVVPITTG